jgi:hypothetical protein
LRDGDHVAVLERRQCRIEGIPKIILRRQKRPRPDRNKTGDSGTFGAGRGHGILRKENENAQASGVEYRAPRW